MGTHTPRRAGGPSYREAKGGILRTAVNDIHRKRIPLIHHIQRVIALTDIPRAIRNNEIGLAKAELCPSSETDLMPHESHLPALFESPDSTQQLSICSQIGSAAKLFSVKSLFRNTLTLNPLQ